jgi:hypothetical protein
VTTQELVAFIVQQVPLSEAYRGDTLLLQFYPAAENAAESWRVSYGPYDGKGPTQEGALWSLLAGVRADASERFVKLEELLAARRAMVATIDRAFAKATQE